MKTLELLDTRVKSIMTAEVTTVKELDNMDVVNNIFQKLNVHHLPVVSDEGALVGIISKTDLQLLKHWATNYNLRTAEKQNRQILNSMLAKDVMNRNVTTVSPENTLERCALLFRKNAFHSLPVVENGELVGIITTYDLLSVAFSL